LFILVQGADVMNGVIRGITRYESPSTGTNLSLLIHTKVNYNDVIADIKRAHVSRRTNGSSSFTRSSTPDESTRLGSQALNVDSGESFYLTSGGASCGGSNGRDSCGRGLLDGGGGRTRCVGRSCATQEKDSDEDR
jgi:hypothetical protein